MKPLIVALQSILTVSILLGAGTWAWYTDTEVSANNALTTGTLDLYLANGNPSPNAKWLIPHPGSFPTEGYPGYPIISGDIRLYNLGSLSAQHVDINCQLIGYEDDDGDLNTIYTGDTPVPEPDEKYGPDGMAKALKVDRMEYTYDSENSASVTLVEGGVVTSYGPAYGLDDHNENGYLDLEDLAYTGIQNLAAPPVSGVSSPSEINLYTKYTQLDMDISLVESGEPQNDFQGDVIEMVLEVELNQHESQ